MDIEELNRQMSFFQNDYNHNYNQNQPRPGPGQEKSINFPPPLETPMPSTQVKRPTRTTGTHRNEINDKMAQMKLTQPMFAAPNQFQLPAIPQTQHSRNNSQYQDPNQQHMENLPNMLAQHYQQEKANPLSAYFQQNYSTLNGMQNQPIPSGQFNIPTQMQMQQSTHHPMANYNTHSGGQAFVNPSNLPVYAPSPSQTLPNQQQPGNGYQRMDEKRIDYRQNMNSKVGDFIFDNPNAARYNPQQVAYNPNQNPAYPRDTRMVIQDSSKDMYRQEANSRMAQYSPLARASHVPINIANMSVNDFYSSMNPAPNHANGMQTAEDDARAVLNARMGAYAPLARATPLEKPRTWEGSNINQVQPLVAHEELPIISH